MFVTGNLIIDELVGQDCKELLAAIFAIFVLVCAVEEVGIREHHAQDAKVDTDRPVIDLKRSVDPEVGSCAVVLVNLPQVLK